MALKRTPRPSAVRWRWASPKRVFLSLAVIVVMMLTLDPFERMLAAEENAWVITTGRLITNLGNSGYYLVPLGVGLILLPLLRPGCGRIEAGLRQIWLRLAFAVSAITATGLAATLIKHVVGRVRPNHVLNHPVIDFEPFSFQASFASLPSGHSTTIATVAALCFLFLGRRVMPYVLPLVLAVMASRVMVSAHFPADVVAGALMGWALTIGYGRFVARRGLVFHETRSGALVPRGRHAVGAAREWLSRRGWSIWPSLPTRSGPPASGSGS
jgi:membrane-associated phospholipid phosphatase